MTSSRVAIITDCSPEEETLKFVETLKKEGIFSVLVLNRLGDDDFSKKAKDLGAVICCGLEGETVALCASLAYVRETFVPPYSVALVPFNGCSDIECIFKVFKTVEHTPDAFAVSQNVIGKGKFFLKGKIVARKFLYRHFTGAEIYGDQSSALGFSDRLLPSFEKLPDNSYEYHIKFLMRCREKGFRVSEVSVPAKFGNSGWTVQKSSLRSFFKRHMNVLKFCMSSFSAFLVDYLVYSLILAYSEKHINVVNLTFANVFARIISSTMNFTVNRKFVFKAETGLLKSATQFYTLAAIILLGNSILLNFLANVLGINHYFAKIVTEMTFFLLNWTIQSMFIFKK